MNKLIIACSVVAFIGAVVAGLTAEQWNPWAIKATQGIQVLAEKTQQEKKESQELAVKEVKSLSKNSEVTAEEVLAPRNDRISLCLECLDLPTGKWDSNEPMVTAITSPGCIECY